MNYAVRGLIKIPQTIWKVLVNTAYFFYWLGNAFLKSLWEVLRLPVMILEYWGGKPELQGTRYIGENCDTISNFNYVFFTNIAKLPNNDSLTHAVKSHYYSEGNKRFAAFSCIVFVGFLVLGINECSSKLEESVSRQEIQRRQIEEDFAKEYPNIHKTIKTTKDIATYLLN